MIWFRTMLLGGALIACAGTTGGASTIYADPERGLTLERRSYETLVCKPEGKDCRPKLFTQDILKAEGSPRDEAVVAEVRDCSVRNLKCTEGLFKLAVDDRISEQGSFVHEGVLYRQRCAERISGYCAAYAVEFEGKSGIRSGDVGRFVYRRGVGVQEISSGPSGDSFTLRHITGIPFLAG